MQQVDLILNEYVLVGVVQLSAFIQEKALARNHHPSRGVFSMEFI
jgi:hypothetical protein